MLNSFWKIVVISCLWLASLCAVASAAKTEWQDLGGGKARLIVMFEPGTDQISGALEVKLKPGWSTYWRYPGGFGIPPQFDFTQSSGFTVEPVAFPAPSLLGGSYGQYAGYKKSVVFPFKGKLSARGGQSANPSLASLKLRLLIGVCEEICIPAQAQFSIDGSSLLQSDLTATQIISFSALTVPIKKPYSDLGFQVDQNDKEQLIITVETPVGDQKPSLFVEGPLSWSLQPAKLVSRDGDKLNFALDVSNAPEGTDVMGEKLRYTLVTGSSGFEFEH